MLWLRRPDRTTSCGHGLIAKKHCQRTSRESVGYEAPRPDVVQRVWEAFLFKLGAAAVRGRVGDLLYPEEVPERGGSLYTDTC